MFAYARFKNNTKIIISKMKNNIWLCSDCYDNLNFMIKYFAHHDILSSICVLYSFGAESNTK